MTLQTHAHAHASSSSLAGRRLALTALLSGFIVLGAMPQAAQAATEGSGRVVSETRQVADFSGIALRGSMNLVVSQGDKVSVTVRADDNLLPLLETVVEGTRLEIGWKRGEQIRRASQVTVTVVTPRLSDVAVAGSGNVEVGSFDTPSLKLAVAGSGNARLAGLKTNELGLSISGSGDVRGSGQAGKLTVSIAGSGDVRVDGMKADEVSVRIAGSGNAEVNAEKTLAVSIAGSGDVLYSGNATVSRSVAGSGSIKKR